MATTKAMKAVVEVNQGANEIANRPVQCGMDPDLRKLAQLVSNLAVEVAKLVPGSGETGPRPIPSRPPGPPSLPKLCRCAAPNLDGFGRCKTCGRRTHTEVA